MMGSALLPSLVSCKGCIHGELGESAQQDTAIQAGGKMLPLETKIAFEEW